MMFIEVENKKGSYNTKHIPNHLLKKIETAAMATVFHVYIREIKSN